MNAIREKVKKHRLSDLVNHSNVNAGDGNRARFAAAHDRFAEDMRPIGCEHEGGLCLIEDGVERSAAMRLAADGVYAAIGAASARHFLELVIDLHVIEVDGLGASL